MLERTSRSLRGPAGLNEHIPASPATSSAMAASGAMDSSRSLVVLPPPRFAT